MLKSRKVLIILGLLSFVQCDSFITSEPSGSEFTVEYVDPDFLLNSIQLETPSIFRTASQAGAELTRMYYMYGDTYANAFSPSEFNDIYGNSFNDQFIDSQTLLSVTEERSLFAHSGISKVLKAYTMLTLVDLFGDMPYSDQLNGSELNPKLMDDEIIYVKALELLNEAIADLNNPNNRSMPENDFYFGNMGKEQQIEHWIRTANTLKLKALLNMGNRSKVQELISENILITDSSHDFQFRYSANSTNPDSRHPKYSRNYINNTGASDYLSISYMNMLLNSKPDQDPRLPYYIYRQTTSSPSDINESPCLGSFLPDHFDNDDPFCSLPTGYIGRGHLSDWSGVYHYQQATFGVYPAGGSFDHGNGEPADEGDGLAGAGIQPLLLSTYTHFMIAEAELVFNNDVNKAREALRIAIEQSLSKVAEFGASLAQYSSYEITDSTISSYTTFALQRYDNATNNEEKLRAISFEYYLALWGNGLEAYNLMRRTGYPDRKDNLQPAKSPNPGNWHRSLLYPFNMVDRNENVDQKDNDEILIGPFWDPNPSSTKFNF